MPLLHIGSEHPQSLCTHYRSNIVTVQFIRRRVQDENILAINEYEGVKENCKTVLQNDYNRKCPWSKSAPVNGVMNWLCWWFLKFWMERRGSERNALTPPSLKVDHYQLYTRCNLVCLFVCLYKAHPFSSLTLVWVHRCVCVCTGRCMKVSFGRMDHCKCQI